MAQTIELYKKCSQCNGIGTFQPAHGPGGSPITCTWPGCNSGYILCGKYNSDPGHDDIMDKCNDIINKCNDILEALP